MARLHEYEGKTLLAANKIAVPAGNPARSPLRTAYGNGPHETSRPCGSTTTADSSRPATRTPG